MPFIRRMHLFELDDQPWFPSFLHSRLQACLTACWTTRIPFLQRNSPAQLVTQILFKELGAAISQYTFIDCCAGAGGPTPIIARLSNVLRGHNDPLAHFALADIKPLPEVWGIAVEEAKRKGGYLHYIPRSLDASQAFNAAVLETAVPPLPEQAEVRPFRLFFLSYHHFDDPLARAVLKSTLATCDGFAIVELQDRTFASFLTIFLLGPLLALLTPFWFWRDPLHLALTYLLPLAPAVLVFDGYMSSLRTRSMGEVLDLLGPDGSSERRELLDGWKVRSGKEYHTKPIGMASWIIGTKM